MSKERLFVVSCDFTKSTPPLRVGDFVVFMGEREWSKVSEYRDGPVLGQLDLENSSPDLYNYIKEHGFWGKMVSRTDDHMTVCVDGNNVRIPVEEVKCAVMRRSN